MFRLRVLPERNHLQHVPMCCVRPAGTLYCPAFHTPRLGVLSAANRHIVVTSTFLSSDVGSNGVHSMNTVVSAFGECADTVAAAVASR
jgi:hypothetical protein